MDIKQFHKLLLILFLVCIQYGLSIMIDEDYIDEPSFNRCPWIRNKLKNGRVRYRYKGRVAKFLCDSGFELAGKRSSTCVRGQWSNPVPVCVARGCSRLPPLTNGRITEMYRGAFLVYDCNPGYVLDGNPTNYCNGRTWYTSTPLCIVATTNPEAYCDFENPDLCGWTQDPNHDFDWQRNHFSTPSGHVGTGPSFDHTFGENKGGFYLFIEASSPRKINDTARLFSPVYPKELSGGCFTFWYHMYGATTGRLRVYLKPESHVFDELRPNWEKIGDQGNQWLKGHMIVPVLQENFQIVVEGVRGESYVGDSAIDDVRLTTNLCNNEDNSTDITEAVDQNSCRGRCQESGTESSCGCNSNCVDEPNFCCRDYYTICTSGNFTTIVNSEEPLPEDYTTTSSVSTKSSTYTTITISEEDVNVTTELTTEKLESTSGKFSVISSTILLTPTSQTSNESTTEPSVIPVSYSGLNSSSTQYNTNSQSTTLSSFSMTSTPLKTEPFTKSTSTLKTTQTVSLNNSLATENSTQAKSTVPISKAIISSTTPEKTSTTIQEMPRTTKSTIFTTSTQTTPKTTITIRSIFPTTLKTTTLSVPVSELKNNFTTISKSTSSYGLDLNRTSSAAAMTVNSEQSNLPVSSTSVSTTTATSTTVTSTTVTSTMVTSTTASTTTVPSTTEMITRKTYNLRPRNRTTLSTTYTVPTVSSTTQTSSTTNAPLNKEPSFTTRSNYLTSWYRYSISSTKPTPTSLSKITVRPLIPSTSYPRWETTVENMPLTTKFSDRIRKPTKSHLPKTSEFYDSGASKAETTSTSNVPVVVSIIIIILICLIIGLAYYIKRHRNKRQSKLSDDSEMRFLQENDYMEYSDASVLDRILVK